ncbi:MAG: hypothetical protein AAGU14_12005 [Eubacteriaceae bacterium]
MSIIENKFNEDMINIYFTVKKELKYNAAMFFRLLSEKGGLQTAKILIAKNGGTSGFRVLFENKRLDLSVEALVLRPEYITLFTDEERKMCKDRLNEFGYKI